MGTQLIPLRSSRTIREMTPDRLLRGIRRKLGRSIREFPKMIEEGDRIMVCVSGGKDSYALLDLLLDLQKRAPIQFHLLALNIDQGWPGYDTDRIKAHLETRNVPYEMINENYATLVEERLKPGQTPCSLCSRFRRGVLYRLADEFGMTKIALGHHADDLIETVIMNMFYSGRLASMPATLTSDDGQHRVIRPLVYVSEEELIQLAALREYPVVRCGCPSCGLPEQKRQVVKRLLTELSQNEPEIKNNMLAALGNVRPSHLLDSRLVK